MVTCESCDFIAAVAVFKVFLTFCFISGKCTKKYESYGCIPPRTATLTVWGDVLTVSEVLNHLFLEPMRTGI